MLLSVASISPVQGFRHSFEGPPSAITLGILYLVFNGMLHNHLSFISGPARHAIFSSTDNDPEGTANDEQK